MYGLESSLIKPKLIEVPNVQILNLFLDQHNLKSKSIRSVYTWKVCQINHMGEYFHPPMQLLG